MHCADPLCGPSDAVLEELHQVYATSVRRCWLALCNLAVGGAHSRGGRAGGSSPCSSGELPPLGGGPSAAAALADETPEMSLQQLCALTKPLSETLEHERRVFHGCFAVYAPSIADAALVEWGRAFHSALEPTLRTHATAAVTPSQSGWGAACELGRASWAAQGSQQAACQSRTNIKMEVVDYR